MRWKLWELAEILNQREAAMLRFPESQVIAAAYHRALEEHRALENELYPDSKDGPLRQPGDIMLPPDWIAGVLKQIGRHFNQKDESSAGTLLLSETKFQR